MIALNKIFGFSPAKGKLLLRKYPRPEELFGQGDNKRIDISDTLYSSKFTEKSIEEACREMEFLESHGYKFLTIQNENYPELLKECEDSPIGIYVRSNTDISEIFKKHRTHIGIVGTRDPSPYGIEVCRNIVRELGNTKEKPLIISGLAFGIDITAHKTAIECGLPTVAVLPTGIDAIYPKKHEWFAETIQSTPGCALITDYPLKTSPLQINFIKRNRIIAGLGNALILIESKIKGGGMITAKIAHSYNRDIYAVPGRIGDIRSSGCNLLIKKNFAYAICDEKTLVSDLGLSHAGEIPQKNILSDAQKILRHILSEKEFEMILKILEILKNESYISMQDLQCRLDVGVKTLNYMIGILQSEGMVVTDLMENCHINKKKI